MATQFESLGLLKDRSIRTIAHPLGGWTLSTKFSNTARACFISNLQANVMADSAPPDRIPNQANPCDHLSLEELRRAEAAASSDKPPQ